MSLKLIFGLIAISGIFSKKNEELDILPPPPPFPEIGKESGEAKEARRIREEKEKQKERGIELKRKKEEKKRKQEERERKRIEVEKEKREKELELERKKVEKKHVKEEKLQKPKKTIFERIFGEKKGETEFAKELEEIEKIAPRPVKEKRAKKAKLEMPELISLKAEKFEEETAKPEEIIKAEEEIEKAISGMKKAKRPSILKGLFKKKKLVEEKIEIPEVMPRTYDKVDYVELIEEKIHKARLALMDFKFDDAKRVYIDVMEMYNELEPKKKSKVYQDIKDLYYERKSAEKFVK